MSDIRFNRWLHQSGTGGVSQDSSGNIGIGTTVPTMALDVRGDINVGDTININNASGIISATTITATTGTFSGNMSVTGNVSIAGTLTYEDVSNIDAVGIITAQSDIVVGGGLTVTGISTFNNDVKLLDSDKLKFGIGEDLQIYHNGSHSIIEESGTGNLSLRTNSLIKFDTNGNETLAEFTKNGSIDLYYDNSKKFETTNTGAIVTGILTATTFSGNLTGNVTGDLTGNLAGISSIAAISSSISDTAVDVFVYDTRKDSDGGAWRKRTQNTSWYNDTLNSATRGNRREFPAVAVIVAEASKVTIYDGDDPDLPLWMSFPTNDAKAITAINGEISLGAHSESPSYHGLLRINFVADQAINHRESGSVTVQGYFIYKLSSTDRAKLNDGPASWTGYRSEVPNIVNGYCNDVAMTVLPNAPIDSATGLPVPTIAVATNNGVSVIKDDGTIFDVIDSNGSRRCYDVSFTKDHKIMHTGDLGAGVPHAGNVFVTNVLTADRTEYDNHGDLYRWYSTSAMYPRINGGNTYNTRVLDPLDIDGHHYAMADVGISLIEDGISSSYGNTDGMVAYITSDYNTGYMHGDIKGAFLSDTDTTNATDSQKVNWNNGSDVSGSYGGTTAASATVVSNTTITITAAAGGYAYYDVGFTPVSGKKYVATLTGSNYSGSNPYGLSTGGGFSINMRRTSNGTVGPEVITSAGNAIPIFVGNSVTVTVELTIYELVEEDRSVNNTGLQVVGTVTKSAVATGAELVSYGPFSTSNRLRQPYNADLNFETNDFSVMLWMYNTGSTVHQTLVGRDNREFSVDILDNANYDRKFRVYAFDSSNSMGSFDSNADPFPLNTWTHVCVNYTNGDTVAVYVNGVLNKSGTLNYDIDDTSNGLNIGCRNTSGSYAHAADATKLALMRISKSAPSPEQIKKIYEDEKVLFQENAKATLYGSSNAVTALAFDDTTNLLHVGTSAGRSEFQGLRRINNTTTAVTTAISASNGLVAEQ